MKGIEAPLEEQDGQDGSEDDTRAAEHHRQAGADVLQAHALQQNAGHTEEARDNERPDA